MLRKYLLLLLIAAVPVACGSSDPSESATPIPPAGAPEGRRVDLSSAGTLSGQVRFEGEAPAAQPINMSADRKCDAGGATNRPVAVSGGGLENVFVYVKDDLREYAFDIPADPVKLDQNGCVYHPRVVGVRVGQPIEISNSDALLHNVHAAAATNPQFNTAQPFKGMRHTHSFKTREVMVPFKCDVHSWMIAYVGVLEHPYFAVTGAGGEFELKGLPPGTYTIEAWHETLGTRTAQVTVGERETQDLGFTFTAS